MTQNSPAAELARRLRVLAQEFRGVRSGPIHIEQTLTEAANALTRPASIDDGGLREILAGEHRKVLAAECDSRIGYAAHALAIREGREVSIPATIALGAMRRASPALPGVTDMTDEQIARGLCAAWGIDPDEFYCEGYSFKAGETKEHPKPVANWTRFLKEVPLFRAALSNPEKTDSELAGCGGIK